MKSIKNRALALILCLTLVLGCVGLVHADNDNQQTADAAEASAETELPSDSVSDNEAVYILTDAVGAVQKLIVSDRYKDADGQESSKQTQEEKELPVDVRITYRLDGKEIAPVYGVLDSKVELMDRSTRVILNAVNRLLSYMSVTVRRTLLDPTIRYSATSTVTFP